MNFFEKRPTPQVNASERGDTAAEREFNYQTARLTLLPLIREEAALAFDIELDTATPKGASPVQVERLAAVRRELAEEDAILRARYGLTSE